jgi:hypothetical protein
MSSGLRRPATRDAHTKYFIVLEDMSGGSVSTYPPPIGYVTRSPTISGTVTSVMTEDAFNKATGNITSTYFQLPPVPTVPPALPLTRGYLIRGDILKDLGSTVYLFDQLGSPDSKHFATYRLVQLVAGGESKSPVSALPNSILTEGPYGSASNFYNTFWIRTWTSSPQWFHVAAIARTG